MADRNITIRTTSPARVFDMLSLTDKVPDLAVIKKWSPRQRAQAYEWAAREVLGASDNDVRRLKIPKHVAALADYKWETNKQ